MSVFGNVFKVSEGSHYTVDKFYAVIGFLVVWLVVIKLLIKIVFLPL